MCYTSYIIAQKCAIKLQDKEWPQLQDKNPTRRCNSELSNTCKNIWNGPESVEKLNYQLYITSCIITQKPAMELLNEYWPHLQALNLA
jgi:hypothetical protein